MKEIPLLYDKWTIEKMNHSPTYPYKFQTFAVNIRPIFKLRYASCIPFKVIEPFAINLWKNPCYFKNLGM